MKAVMISIQPKWCELIANEKKTIEVRKTRPNIETPFKCYIYCTYGKGLIEYYDYFLSNCLLDETVSKSNTWGNCCNGKVIGEFVCDKVEKIECCSEQFNMITKDASMTLDDIMEYCNGEDIYAWHISDLKIYYEPKKLREFRTPPCEKGEKACENCKNIIDINTPNGHERECYVDDGKIMSKPPRSWQYCEELEEKKNE